MPYVCLSNACICIQYGLWEAITSGLWIYFSCLDCAELFRTDSFLNTSSIIYYPPIALDHTIVHVLMHDDVCGYRKESIWTPHLAVSWYKSEKSITTIFSCVSMNRINYEFVLAIISPVTMTSVHRRRKTVLLKTKLPICMLERAKKCSVQITSSQKTVWIDS